jgi:lysophospholipase L1-like esterase
MHTTHPHRTTRPRRAATARGTAIATALALALLAAATGDAQPEQRLANGSFEDTLISGLPAEWDVYCPRPGDYEAAQLSRGSFAVFATDTGVAHSGAKSARLSSAVPVRCSLIQRSIPARAGEKWRFSFWMKADSLASIRPKEGGANARLSFLSTTSRETTVRLGPLSQVLSADAGAATFDWRKFEVQGEVPDGADILQIELFLHRSPGTVWFDDLSLTLEAADGTAPAAPAKPVDRAGLLRHRAANAALPAGAAGDPPRVVFLGDSITEGWPLPVRFPDFPGALNRGIGGQHIWQMMARFPQDVLALRPDALVFMGGSNDIGGDVPLDVSLGNIRAILAAGRDAGIPVLVCSVLPVSDIMPGNPRTPRRPPARILEFNTGLRALCEENNAWGGKVRYLDLHSLLTDPDGLLRADLTRDGLHLLPPGYALISPPVSQALAATLRDQKAAK